MQRLRAVNPLTIVALAAAAGYAGCDRVPLLAPTGSVINLTLASDVAALNSSVDVTAVVIEAGSASSGTGTTATTTSAAGTPVQNGTVVSFTTTIGHFEPDEARTSNGKVTVKLVTAGESGKATITAYSGGAQSTAQITIGAAAVAKVALSANPLSLPSSGGTVTLTARATDANGNAVPGVAVTFATTKGQLASPTVATNASGVATTTLTTNAAADVTATSGTITSDKASVTISTRATLTLAVASASVNVVSGPAAFTVTPGTTALSNVVINFGDGATQSLGAPSGAVTVTHYYSEKGTYGVSATGTDPDGVSVSSGQTSVAIAPIGATVAATASGKTVTATVTLDPNSGLSIDHYEWDFGDEATPNPSSDSRPTSFGKTQSHVYLNNGTYTIAVRIVPAYGASFVISVPVVVS